MTRVFRDECESYDIVKRNSILTGWIKHPTRNFKTPSHHLWEIQSPTETHCASDTKRLLELANLISHEGIIRYHL